MLPCAELWLPCACRAAFFERDVLRVAYVQARLEQKEAQHLEHADAANPEAQAAEPPGGLQVAEEAKGDDDGFDPKAEEAYRALEAAFRAELGLQGEQGFASETPAATRAPDSAGGDGVE